MGAVIGISAYGRTQEKLGGANNGGINLGAGTSYTPPAPVAGTGFGGTTNATTNTPGGFTAPSAPATGGFNSNPGAGAASFGSVPAPSGFDSGSFGSAPATTASGKKIVPGFDQPLI